MFSENERISSRQLKRLVVLDWIGKACLLLPLFIERSDGRSFTVSLMIGLVLSLFYICLISWLGRQVQNDYFGYVQNRMGKGAALVLALVYWLYAFVNTVYLVRLFGEVAGTFLLPELGQEILFALVVAAGCYGAFQGLEGRARTAEALYGILLIPLGILLLAAAIPIRSEYLSPGQAALSLEMLGHGLQVFMAFGGAGIFLFVAPRVERKKEFGKALRRSVVIVGGAALAMLLTSIGTFGEEGVRALPWPVITLMSTVEIPGGFLQRWDVVFTGLLLTTFFIAVSTGMFYIRLMSEQLLPWRRPKVFLLFGALAVFLAACWCKSYETAARVYVVVNGYVMVPLAVGITCLLALIEWNKKRRKA